MKIFLIITCIVFNSFTILAQKEFIRLITLPDNAKYLINQKYGKWDFFNSTIPYFDSTGKHTAWEYADIIRGDFDDNHISDFALLVKPDSSIEGYFVVLLNYSDSYKLVEICEVPHHKDIILYLVPKGTTEYNFDLEEEFLMPIDGVALYVYEKAGSTYYYNGNYFTHFLSSD